MTKLTAPQRKALRLLVESRVITRPGGEKEIKPPPDRSGPFSGKDAPTWLALERLGLVERAGSGVVQSGSFSWRMPSYRITDKGRDAVPLLDDVHVGGAS